MRTLAIALVMLAWLGGSTHAEDRINAVIGDVAGGHDEQSRIRSHLTYVLEHLRAKPGRAASLDALERYIARGEFPRRTDDAFSGRRPRFIDDRGVHCAVGYLIAASGEPELARTINAKHEYDYVREIDEPALVDWAERAGFTLDELAMIQPTYGELSIDAGRARQLIERAQPTITVACARKHKPLANVTLRLRGKDDRFTAAAEGGGAFARCFAEHATKIDDKKDGRGRQVWIETFESTVTIALDPPAKLFAQQMDHIVVSPDCSPRPGALAREATIEITSNQKALTVKVTTSPSNAEVETCLVKQLVWYFGQFGAGNWTLHGQRTRSIPTRITDERFKHSIEYAGRDYAKRCAPAGLGQKLTITASARVDDPNFTIALDAGDATFKSCVSDLLLKYLRNVYSGLRTKPDGSLEPYFRIDANVHTRVTVEPAP
jgi:hypothetical protein